MYRKGADRSLIDYRDVSLVRCEASSYFAMLANSF